MPAALIWSDPLSDYGSRKRIPERIVFIVYGLKNECPAVRISAFTECKILGQMNEHLELAAGVIYPHSMG